MAAEVRIGASGWHYKHWRGPFYPADLPASRMLDYYVRFFDTVELNNTFYSLPAESAVRAWRDSTPPGFCFAVKGSRFLTHMKKLKDPDLGLERFFSRVEPLAGKLGPIVFQLPPRWQANPERLAAFLAALHPGHRYSFEFREPSWHNPQIYDLLRRHNAAFCIYELAGFHSPLEITADFTYVRLHGPTDRRYQGSYSDKALSNWAARIDAWREQLSGLYVYFDNDDSGFAVANARDLRRLAGLASGF